MNLVLNVHSAPPRPASVARQLHCDLVCPIDPSCTILSEAQGPTSRDVALGAPICACHCQDCNGVYYPPGPDHSNLTPLTPAQITQCPFASSQ